MSGKAVRKARRQSLQEENPSSDFELFASLLPSSTMNDSTDEEEDSETEDLLRESILLLLVLMYTQAHNQLESMDQELELLRSMPPPPPLTEEDARSSKGKEKDDMWKLDSPMPSGGPDGKGPLMDDSGKVKCYQLRTYAVVLTATLVAPATIYDTPCWCSRPCPVTGRGLPARPSVTYNVYR